jgi:aspartate/methionine/tyrosine aminotransferase
MLDATLRDRASGLLTASRRSDVPPFMVMDVMAAAARIEAAGGHVIHMEVGQPAAAAPKAAIAAAHAALGSGRIDYTSALGIPSLRERIARHYRDGYGCAVDAGRIVVTTGSSGAFILAFLAMFEPGDRVAVTVPGYPPYRHILTALGCEPVLIETSSETRHALTGEALLAAHRRTPLKGVLVGSPANPTGTMMSREALTSLISVAEAAGIRFISDEIYHGLDYSFPAVTAAELSPHALVINSFSKYFCMTGWRVGWMVVPEPLARPIERLQQNLAISVPTLSQIAAEAAFDGGNGSGEAWLPGEPPHSDRGSAARRPHQISARRRRVLPLCRRLGFHRRQFRVCQPDAGAGARRGNPRHRFRSGSRPFLHPVFLCSFGRGNARRGCAHRAMARIALRFRSKTLYLILAVFGGTVRWQERRKIRKF